MIIYSQYNHTNLEDYLHAIRETLDEVGELTTVLEPGDATRYELTISLGRNGSLLIVRTNGMYGHVSLAHGEIASPASVKNCQNQHTCFLLADLANRIRSIPTEYFDWSRAEVIVTQSEATPSE